MSTPAPSIGGRPATVTLDDVVAVGREIGMRDLSVAAVAQRLGVTPTALYRHVTNRWGLERLVGESLLADLDLADDDLDDDLETHLLRLSLALHDFALARPGLATYLLTLFPRGDAGLRLLDGATRQLVDRGLCPEVALVAANVVASTTFALTAAQEQHGTSSPQDHDLADEIRAATVRVAEHDGLADAVVGLPPITGEDYVRMLLAVCVRGVVATIPDRGGATVVAHELGARLARAGRPLTHPTES